MSCQQFLGDGIAVVMREDVESRYAGVSDDRFAEIRLCRNAVRKTPGLGGESVSDEIRREQPVAVRKNRPQPVPVPGRRGKSVDQQYRRPVRSAAVVECDVMAVIVDPSPKLPPLFKIHCRAPQAIIVESDANATENTVLPKVILRSGRRA